MRLVLLLAALTSLVSLSWSADPPRIERPKLAVLIYVDQLRGDYLMRWRDLFEKDGFRRLTDEGAWFVDCHYPYSGTLTGPGHATVATGCTPDVHGIIANEWFVRSTAKTTNCVASPRSQQVPPPKVTDKDTKKTSFGPELLLAPTIGDALKAATDGKGRVVALSIKNRSAILPAGRRPDAVYWADEYGQFITSTYYRDKEHAWVREVNQSGLWHRWAGHDWTRLRPDLNYTKFSGKDNVKGEAKGSSQGRTFPHPFNGGPKKSRKEYVSAVACSPFGNDFLFELVKKAIIAEKLGSRDVPDLLSMSFSSNDIVGHSWGPDSQEVLDTTLRADLLMRDLLRFLDAQVGKGKYVIVLTADHGICPIPEVATTKGHKAGRIVPKALIEDAEIYLDTKFPAKEVAEKKKPAAWIESSGSNMMYLNRRLAKSRGTTTADVAQELARWIVKQPGIQDAFTAADLAKPATDDIGRQLRRSYFADRSGDVMLVTKPYHFLTSSLTGTTHGSPHRYDTHVPLIVYGSNVIPGRRKERVSPEAASVILAEALGIAPPAKAAVKVPTKLFR